MFLECKATINRWTGGPGNDINIILSMMEQSTTGSDSSGNKSKQQ